MLLGAGNWLLPPTCSACQSTISDLDYPFCNNCYTTLPFQRYGCGKCGQVFAANQDYCGRCISKPPPFDECFCPYQYASPISEQIRDFKYHQRPELARPLAQILAREILANQLDLPDLLVPVPMHLSRLANRGYNQSVRLAQELGRILDIEANHKLLIKKHKTTPQAKLTLKQRSTNLKGSFSIKRSIQASRVAIIDDVVTTGATAAEIAKILKRNGVDYVQVWGIAHTV